MTESVPLPRHVYACDVAADDLKLEYCSATFCGHLVIAVARAPHIVGRHGISEKRLHIAARHARQVVFVLVEAATRKPQALL